MKRLFLIGEEIRFYMFANNEDKQIYAHGLKSIHTKKDPKYGFYDCSKILCHIYKTTLFKIEGYNIVLSITVQT